jgi:hypothetical protein
VAAHPSAPDTSSSRVSVPKLNKDPIQSLQPLSVELTIAGQEFDIPAQSAAEWLTVLMVEDLDLSDIFPGMVEDPVLVEDLILDGKLGLEELEETIFSVVEVVSARPWYVTLRLVETARVSWDIVGAELLLRGVDATKVSLAAWLDMALLVILRTMDPKDIQMFTLKLESPPPSAKKEEADMEMSASQFMTMAG